MGIHDELYSEGAKLGFAKGGRVKDTGNMPAKKDGDSAQEKEAGGRGKLRPGYGKGGKATKRAAKGVDKMAAKGVKKVNKIRSKTIKTHNKKPLIGS